ncbi:MAG: ATP-dependent protease ATPase subunit HslU [Phycisphaerales bacterium]|nr:ATP-dependent protease ATPase subunit HslU [Phycisphaerales bacterium]
MTPKEIVTQLDRHIIGQERAKKAVAIAVRNRWRRRQLDPDVAREIAPKNIIMVGPTGVGKTEIARRLAGLVNAPFLKVESSKYTEVGYHGRDVESMIRDLLDLAVNAVRQEHSTHVREIADAKVEDRLVDLLLGHTAQPRRASGWVSADDSVLTAKHGGDDEAQPEEGPRDSSRELIRRKLQAGELDDKSIDITVEEKSAIPMIGGMGEGQLDPGMQEMLSSLIPSRSKTRSVTVREARSILLEEETEKLLDRDKVIEEAIQRAEETGIIFLDEIDKLALSAESGRSGADVSRQGVQRDLLPIVEGSSVSTRHGIVQTDHILFIAAGAFHSASVSDLMPELQGRFPIRVELDALTADDFQRILTEPDNAILGQQRELLSVETLNVSFDDDSIEAMAQLAAEANAQLQNIGARRLMTIVEQVFEQINFDAPQMAEAGDRDVRITAQMVRERIAPLLKDADVSKFVL